MDKVRIIERKTNSLNGVRVEYVIQQRHFFFFWMWVDAWVNSPLGTWCNDSFWTLKEAKKNLCHFGGDKDKVKVISLNKKMKKK